MTVSRQHLTTGLQGAMYSPDQLAITVSYTTDTTSCPNCLLIEPEVTPGPDSSGDIDVWAEVFTAARWRPWDWETPIPVISAAPPVIDHEGFFIRNPEDLDLNPIRVFALDGRQGGKVERYIESVSSSGWYRREAEWVDGVGYDATTSPGSIVCNVVIGGTTLTPKHRIGGSSGDHAYGLYDVTIELHIWTTKPDWAFSQVDTMTHADPATDPDLVVSAAASLVDVAQPYHTATLDISALSVSSSGVVWCCAYVELDYAEGACKLPDGPLSFREPLRLVAPSLDPGDTSSSQSTENHIATAHYAAVQEVSL